MRPRVDDPTATVKPKTECVFRLVTGAKEGQVWKPFHPVLDN